MSSTFIINLKKHHLDFDKMNNLAKELVEFSLQKNIGIFFNAYDYADDLIEDACMQDFITLSDSFLYKNCDFLDTSYFDVSNEEKFYNDFTLRFKFLNEILEIISRKEVSSIEVFISCDGSVNKVSDFTVHKCSLNNFLSELFKSITKYSHKYAYGFPTIKFDIQFN